MFIVCSNCEFKYLVNSADLKPNGRKVECANCGHQWYQSYDEKESFSSVPSTKEKDSEKYTKNLNHDSNTNEAIKNLPSTVIRHERPSTTNSVIVVLFIILIILIFWLSKSYGTNTLVLLAFYIKEFFFNLNLIISDLAKIIYTILN